MMNNFDPYDLLIETAERLSRLEQAHNKLAHAYQKSEQDLTTTIQSLHSLQKHYLNLKLMFEHKE